MLPDWGGRRVAELIERAHRNAIRVVLVRPQSEQRRTEQVAALAKPLCASAGSPVTMHIASIQTE